MSKNNGTIARQAAAVGMSKREFLLDLKSRHTKISSMAVELGVTHVAVTCALSKLGIAIFAVVFGGYVAGRMV